MSYLMFAKMTPSFFPLSLPMSTLLGQHPLDQFPGVRTLLASSVDGPFRKALNFLFRLAWSSRMQLPVIITVCFMALDIRLQLEINIFWEVNRVNHHHHHHHHHIHVQNEIDIDVAELPDNFTDSEDDSDTEDDNDDGGEGNAGV